jgi:enoyl-CoA hydratase/carnithine racemase
MSDNNFKYITLEKKGKLCILKFNRPEKKNALNGAARSEILSALDMLKGDNRIKAVIFYGGEKFFSAGFDRDEVQAILKGSGKVQDFIDSNIYFHQKILEYPKLLIAAIGGYALAGAFDLAIICHLRIAANNAVFGHPEVKFGACPAFFPYLTLVGRGKALEILLNTSTQDTFLKAEEAYRLNIVNKIVEPGNVLQESINLAKQILQSPEILLTQLILVNNAFFDQGLKFKNEIDTIVKTMANLLNK